MRLMNQNKVALLIVLVFATNLIVAQECLFDTCQCSPTWTNMLIRCSGNKSASPAGYFPVRNQNVSAVPIGLLEIADYIVDEIPAGAFANLDISSIYLDSNGLKKITKKAFEGIESLRGLFFVRETKIELIEPGAFDLFRQQLTFFSVTYAGLSDEQFLDRYAKELTNMANLTVLDVRSNNFKRITPGHFAGLGQLQEIYLIDNQITDIDLDAFVGLKNLSVIFINGNQLVDLNKVLNATRRLPVRRLSATQNRLTSLPDNCVAGLGSLVLNQNRIEKIGENSLAGCEELTQLELQDNNMSSISDERLRNFTRLKTLKLARNLLTKVPSILAMTNLNQLELSNQNGRLKHIGEFAFERKVPRSYLEVDLSDNEIESFDDKAFCSRHSDDLNVYSIAFTFNSMKALNKCVLKQLENKGPASLGPPYVFVQSNNYYGQNITEVCNCDLYLFAKQLRLTLSGACDVTFQEYRNSKICNEAAYKNPCAGQQRYQCRSSSAQNLSSLFLVLVVAALVTLFNKE